MVVRLIVASLVYIGIDGTVMSPDALHLLIAYWIFSNLVSAMPTPRATDSRWYEFVFRFMHGLAGNITRAAVSLKLPGIEAPKEEQK